MAPRRLVALLVSGLVLAAAPVAAFAHGRTTESCVRMHGRQVTLTAADNAKHICVRSGQEVWVQLRVDPDRYPDPQQWWKPVTETGRALTAEPTILMPARGVTLARYRAARTGHATLMSSRALCPPAAPGQPTCHSIQGWSVTLKVR